MPGQAGDRGGPGSPPKGAFIGKPIPLSGVRGRSPRVPRGLSYKKKIPSGIFRQNCSPFIVHSGQKKEGCSPSFQSVDKVSGQLLLCKNANRSCIAGRSVVPLKPQNLGNTIKSVQTDDMCVSLDTFHAGLLRQACMQKTVDEPRRGFVDGLKGGLLALLCLTLIRPSCSP